MHAHARLCVCIPAERSTWSYSVHSASSQSESEWLGLVAFTLFLSGLHFSFSFALVCRTTSSFKREHIPHKIEIQVPKEGDRKTVCVCDIGRMSNNNNKKKN